MIAVVVMIAAMSMMIAVASATSAADQARVAPASPSIRRRRAPSGCPWCSTLLRWPAGTLRRSPAALRSIGLMSTALDALPAGSRYCPKSLEAQREPVAIG